MAATIQVPRAASKELITLGANIRVARLRRKLRAEIIAQRAGTARQTVAKIEQGDPPVKIGTYVAVLQALDLLEGWGILMTLSVIRSNVSFIRQCFLEVFRPRSKHTVSINEAMCAEIAERLVAE